MKAPPDQAFRFVLLLGLASLFADMTYEAARSITGPYLAVPALALAGNWPVAGAAIVSTHEMSI